MDPSGNARIRVAILLNALGRGGAEVFATDCAAAMDRARFDVRVCYFGGAESLLPVLDQGQIPTVNLGRNGRLDRRAFAALYRFLRAEGIDVLQTHLPYSGIIGRVVGRLARVPAIVSTEQQVSSGYRRRTRVLNDLTLGLADALVCISRGVLESVAQHGLFTRFAMPQIRRVIPNGVEVEAIQSRARRASPDVRARLGLSAEDFVVGTVGRLERQKGQRYLIEALGELLAAVPRAKAVIVGKGSLDGELAALARRLGLEDRVRFLGERTDVFEVLTGFDVFAFPSLFEGLGVVLLEAMAVGVPVVATRIPGVVDVIEHGQSGLLVPPSDARALAGAIVDLARNPALRRSLVDTGRDRVARHFSLAASARMYAALYQEILAHRRTR